MIRKNRRQRLSNFINDCFSNRAARSIRQKRRTAGTQVSGHRSDLRPLESLEDRLLLTYVAPDDILGIFEDQGGAGTDGGGFVQVDTTDANNRIAGGVEEVLAHPTDPNILYAASVNGGIWKTTNGASANPTWVVQTDNLFDAGGLAINQGLSFGAISFDLTDRIDATPYQTLVAATALSSSYNTEGDANPGDPEGGISGQVYVTFDGGDTWTNPGSVGLEGQNIIGIEMEFDRDTGEYIIVAAASEGSNGAAGGGLFRSIDGGATFTPVTNVIGGADFAVGGATNALALVADPTVANPADSQSGRLYAATTGTASGLYRSDDFGANWTRIDSTGTDVRAAITNAATNAIELSVHPTTGRLYVGVLHDGQLGGDVNIGANDLNVSTGIGGIFYASDTDQNTPTWITMDNPWTPVDITPITNWQNTNDTNDGGVEPPNGQGEVRITAAGHRLLTGDLILVRGSGLLDGRWVARYIDNNTISLVGSGALPFDLTGGEIMRIETAVGAATATAENLPQGQVHFSLNTDPNDHNVVYFGLNELDVSNEIGGTATHANLWRGDVTRNSEVFTNSASSQWESLVGDTVAENPQSGTASGTEPHRGSRSITFDANGNLLESSDGGVFRRTSPLNNNGDWTSLAGNLGISEFHSVAYDTVSNAIVAGSVDNGTQQSLITDDSQPDSFEVVLGATIAPSPEVYIGALGLRIGEALIGGSGADVAVGQLANGNSIRYYSHESLGSFTTAEHNAAGNLVATQTRNLQPTDGSTMTAQRGTALGVNALFGDRIVFGAENGIYESFNSGNTVDNASLAVGANIQATPNSAGSVAYGGRSSNDYGDNPYIIYAGDVNGSVWVRNQSAGAFTERVLAAGSPILDVEINPAEWSEAFAITSDSIHRLFIDPDSDPPTILSSTDVTGTLLASMPPGSEIFSIEFINGTGQGVEGIVVGTSTGVYATTIRDLNLGRTNWFQFGSGLPDVQIMDMDYDSTDDVLLLGTLGRGSWTLDNASEYFTPKVSLTVDNAQIFEDATAGSQVATVTATLSRRNYDAPVTILLGSSGDATFTEIAGSAFDANDVNNDDYYREINGVAGNTITIPAGQMSATATFGVALENRANDTTDDRFDEVNELIQVTASISSTSEAEILQTIDTATYAGSVGAITDDAETEFTVDVTDTGLITDLDLAISLLHPDVNNLTAELVSPSGIRITLFDGLTSGANMIGTIFDDEAVAPIAGGLAPFTGRFLAEDQLSAFDGEELAGTWRLILNDGELGDVGSLVSWSLTANRATDPTELPQITIIDDDAAPMIRLVASPGAINEDGSDGDGVLTAQLVDPITGLPTKSGVDVTIPITFAGTATYPDNNPAAPDWTDYLPLLNPADTFATETIVITSGNEDGSLRIRPINDPYNEPSPETAIFGLGTIINGTASTFAGDATSVQIDIIDDDDAPNVTMSITEASITETSLPVGANETTFVATIDEYSEFPIVVYLQLDGTSTAAASDFTLASSYAGALPAGAIAGILIPAGELTGTVTMTAVDDAFYEASPNEVATLSIHSIENSLAVDGSADGQPLDVTIIDNDAVPVVTIEFASAATTTDIYEGDGIANPNTAQVFATLNQAAGHDVVVTIDRTGVVTDTAQDVDYTLNGGLPAGTLPITITISAGELTGTTTASFDLGAFDDDIDEPDQFVEMVVSDAVVGAGTTASFSSAQTITATIIDDDDAPEIELFVNGIDKQQTIDENPEEVATITAALTAASVTSEKDITVTVGVNASSDATRGTGFDYNFIDAASAPIGTPTIDILIPAGSRSATLDLTSLDDALDEFAESVFVDILNIAEGTEAATSLTDPEQQVEIIITDDDDPVLVTLDADRIGIREIPSEVSILTATLNTLSQKDVTVNLTINNASTATNILDYTASTLVITIPAGQLTGSISITALPDALREFDETVIVEIDTVINALEDGQQEVTITILDKKPEADEVVGIFEEHGGAAVINGQTQSADPDRRTAGAIEDVATHPTNADIIYVGSINGGIWKTENATDANPTWEPQTDDLESLSIGAIEFDLDDPTHESLVAGTGRYSSFGSTGGLQGRIYVTDDGGATWESPGSAGLDGENISGVARKGDVIVVTSSENGGGIFRSTDRGVSFTAIDGPDFVSDGSTNFFDLVADPTTNNRLYAAAEDTGVYRSDDFGLTWTKVTGVALGLGDNSELDTLVTNTQNNNLEMSVQPITGRLYLGVVNAGRVVGVFYTSDGDTASPTWTAMDVPRLPAGAAIPITGAAGGPIQITAVAHGLATNDNVVVRNVGGNTAANGYWRIQVTGADTFLLIGSTSNGTYVANSGEVVPVTSPSPGFKDIDEAGSQGRIHFSITAHPTNPNLVYIGGDRQEQPNVIGDGVFGGSIFRGDASISRDDTGIPSPQWDHATNNPTAFDPNGGTASNSGTHADSRDMAFDANGELIEVDDGGIFRRTSPEDNTGDWFSLAGDLGTVEYHSIAYDTVSDLILGGTQDNGTHVQLTPGSNTFRMFNGGDGGDVAVDSLSLAGSDQSIRYYSSQFLGGFRRAIVNADGTTASTQGINLTPTTSGIGVQPQFYTPIALNNLFPTQMVIGGGNGVFESFNQGDTVDLAGAGITATGSAAGPIDYGGRSAVNGDNRYVIYVGDTSGRVHVRTEANGAFVTSPDFGSSIRDVEMDPAEWMTAFAVNSNSVRMTTDAGATWTNITNNLFGVGAGTIHSIQYIDGGTAGVRGIVVGTDRGTFATTTNHLGTWFRFGSGLPDVQIRDMDYDATDDVLILGTLGRGSWCLKDASQFLLPNVVLSTDTLFVNEDGSQTATVTARLSRVNPDADVVIALDSNGTATFTEPGGTGVTPDDYLRDTIDPADGSGAGDPVNYIRIPAGELFGYATFTPIDDAIYEDDEVIEIEATIVTTTEAQLYIRNEAFTETLTYSDTPNAVIPDVSTQSFTINVADVGVVNDLTLNLTFLNDLSHDVTAQLTGPDGTTVTLFDQNGPMFADSVLDAFDGRPSAGDWVLTLTDNALLGVATLSDWSVTIDRTVESTTLPSITIIDDEEAPLVLLSTDEIVINEDGTAPAAATLTVRLVDSSGTTVVTERPVTVNLVVDAASTATGVDDYTLAATTLVINGQPGVGVSSATTTLTAVDDAIYELTENVIIDIDTVVDGVEDGSQQVIIDIIDDEATPSIRIVTDVDTIDENGGVAVVTIELFDPITGALVQAERPVTADLVINGAGTATLTSDYVLGATSLTIAGDAFTPLSSASTTITAVDDPYYELPETVIVDLANVVGANVDGADADVLADGAQQVTVTITDDEAVPSIRLVTDVTSINEDQSVPFEAVLTVELFDPITGNLVLSERPVDVTLEIDAASTATEFFDYTLADMALTISGTPGTGLASVSTTLTALQDVIYELSEDVVVNIASVTNANVDGADADSSADGPQTVTVTIVDDEATPSIRLSVDEAVINEDGSVPGVATVTAELYDPLTLLTVFAERPVTVDLLTSGTANSGNDYDLALSSLLINGDFGFAVSSTTTTVTALQDAFYELPETVIVDLDNADQANIGTPSQVTVTITDDEATPSIRLSVDETSINEDGSAPGVATVTAELYDPLTGTAVFAERPVTVDLLTSGTATFGNDYDLALATLLIDGDFGAAVSSTMTTVTALQDEFYELPETVIVDLSNADQANVGTPSQVTITIQDDEATPSIRLLVDETTINEDGSAPGIATLTAELFDPSTGNTVFAERPVTVDLLTSGTATSGNDYDLALSSLLINGDFGAAVSSVSTTLTALQDAFYELPETVVVDLSNADQANIGTPNQVTVTIVDDEATPSIRLLVDESTINEDGTAPGVATLTAELYDVTTGVTVIAERPVTVDLLTSGTATSGNDYDLASASLTINGDYGVGVSSTTTTVTALQDAFYELPETVIVDLDNADQANIGMPSQVTVTIVDDEATPSIRLSVDETSINEDGSAPNVATLTAELYDPLTGNAVFAERPVTVDLLTSGTATSGNDYDLALATLLIDGDFGAAVSSTMTTVTALQDEFYELPETVIVDLSNADQANVGTPSQVTITIQDDEATPSIRLLVDETTINEDGSAPGIATLTAELFDPSTGNTVFAERPVTVDLLTSGMATSGNDYDLALSSLLINGDFGAAVSSTATTVTALQDAFYELPETVIVDLSNADQANIGTPSQVTVTITDDEVAPSIRLVTDELFINEDGSAPNAATLTVELFDPLSGDLVFAERPVTATIAVDAASTATGGTDYTLASTTLTVNGTFGAGLASASTTVTALQDAAFELPETVIVAIDSVTDAVIDGLDGDLDADGPQEVTVTIVDDEAAPEVQLFQFRSPSFGDLALVSNNDRIEIAGQGVTVVAVLIDPLTGNVVQSERPITVDLAVDASSTATENIDFTLVSHQVVINGSAGAPVSLATTRVNIIGDEIFEVDETVVVRIIAVDDANIGTPATTTMTILDNEATPSVRLLTDTTTVNETAAPTSATITAELFNPATGAVVQTERPVVVELEIGASSLATEGSDYSIASKTLTIAGSPGTAVSSSDTTLTAIDDLIYEITETVNVDILSVVDGLEAGIQRVTVEIADDEVAPSVRLVANPLSINEDGTAPAAADVTAEIFNSLTGDLVVAERPIVIGLAVDASSTADEDADYTLASKTLTIAGSPGTGASAATTTVAAIDDNIFELDETAIVVIVSAVDANIDGADADTAPDGPQTVTVTIVEDDIAPTITLDINSATTVENGGITVVTATLSHPVQAGAIVDIAVSGTATSGTDYLISGLAISIAPNELSGSVNITATQDTLDEPDETVIIDVVGATNATEATEQQQTLTIIDDDDPVNVLLTIDQTEIAEGGGTAIITATLTDPHTAVIAPSGYGVVVNLVLTGTATSGLDYTLPTSITIPIGATSASITLTGLVDNLDEPNETVIASIDTISNGVQLNPQQVTATLIDGDVLPDIMLEAAPLIVDETGGTSTFTLTLSAVSGKDVIVDLNLGGSATGGGVDYDNPPLQVTIPAGDTVATFDINTVADLLNEIDETIVVSISSLTNAVANGPQQQTVTITDDDAVPTVSLIIDQTSILEDAGSATLTATLSAVSGRDITVDLGFSGTADRTDDYIVPAQILIPAGQISATAQLNAIRDLKDEFDEQATIEIASVTNADEDGTQSVSLTIVDSDIEPTVTLSASENTVREDAGTVTFFATLDTVSGKDITVNLELLGEAVPNVDYTAGPLTVQIPAGELQASVVLTLIEDGIDEFDELATIQFVSVVNAVENIVQQASTLIEDTDDAPLVSVAAGALDLIEQNEDSSVITISLSEASAKPVTVSLNFGGTATAVQDYTGRVGTVTIPEGDTSATFVLTATDDLLDESDETIDITIASIVNAVEDGSQLATVTIIDNEILPEISIVGSAAGILEDTETGTFTLELSEASGRDIDVALLVTGFATSDVDYLALPTTVTVPAGTTSFPIALTPIADALAEFDEDVKVTIDAANTPLATTVAGSEAATILILNDENLPTINITSNVATIGEGGGDAILSLTLSEVSGRAITVDLLPSGTATEGADYVDLPDQVVIPAGTLSVDLLLTSINDTIDEFDEDAIVTIAGVDFAAIGTDSVTVTIVDNDPDSIVNMNVSNATIAEDGGVSTVTVSLNAASEKPVIVTLAPVGTATSGSDYVAVPVTVTIAAGDTSATFDVTAINDNEVESQETVILSVAGITNGVFDGLTQTVSIVDDDVPTLFLSLADEVVNEADGAAATMLTVTRNASLSVPMIVTLTSNDTGEATVPMTLSFEAGATSITVPVTAVNDFVLDGTQTVTFTAAAAGFIDGAVDLEVEDATTAVNLSVDVTAGTEADQTVITITATTDKPVIGDQTLDLTVNGTNITASDYILAASTLTFADGTSTATTTFTVQDDGLVEALLETATISITASTNGLASGPTDSVDVDITDNDQASLSISDVTITEGDSGTVTAVLDVTLTGNVDSSFTVDFATADDSATAGDSDYMGLTGQISFGGTDGETQAVSIAVNGDEKVELDEAFFVNLANVLSGTRNVVIGDGSGQVIITNDDSASVSIADASIEETDSGTQILTFTANLDQLVDVPVTLDWATADGTALVADLDYLSGNGQITFTPGTTAGQQATFSIAVVGDEKVELDETLQAILSNLTAAGRNVSIADGMAIGTILNDDQAAFTINDVTVVEGDSGVQNMTFTVTLDSDVDVPVSLDVDTRNVTATFDQDYQPNTGSVLTFSGTRGETQTFNVAVFGDTTVELDETFNVLLSNVAASGREVTIADNTGVGTIVNDDSANLTITGGTVTEGDSGTTNITFTVGLDQTVDTPITIDYATVAGSASETDNDYEAVSGTLSFGANVNGSQSQTITVAVNGDTKVELDELFSLVLSNANFGGRDVTNAVDQAVGHILNDDSATISIADLTLDEGDSDVTPFGFEITIDAEIDTDMTLLLNTVDGTATIVDADYVSHENSVVTLLANTGGAQTVIAAVAVTGDEVVERTETFFVELSGLNVHGRAVTLVDDSATGTITNDDSAGVSIDDVTIEEGDSGTTDVTFTVTLDAEVDHDVNVNYASADQSATAADGDYTAVTPGTLTFAADTAGGQSQTITVSVAGDEKVELNEVFLLNLSGLVSGERLVSMADGSGAATITNDDSASITVTGVSQAEGNDGLNDFTFEATLSAEVDTPVTFQFNPVDGTATLVDDYTSGGGTVTFAANAGTGAQVVSFNVSVDGDVKVETDEVFTVDLSNLNNVGRNITLDTATVTADVLNDDSAEVTVSDAMIVEGTDGSTRLIFDVTLDAEVEHDVSVNYRTANTGNAVGGIDYTPVNGTLTFLGSLGTGAQTLTISVPVNPDSIVELDESFSLQLSDLIATDANVSLADAEGIGTIEDDDVAMITVSSASVVEGSGQNSQMIFTVTLDNAVDAPVAFDYSFRTDPSVISGIGTADPADFLPPADRSGQLSGNAGQSLQFTVNIVSDDIVELDEVFQVVVGNISASGRNVVAGDNATGTILNDDSAVITVDDIQVIEGNTGTTQAIFTIGVSQPVQGPITVNYATEDNIASSTEGDYESTSGTATLSSGSTTVAVTINSDMVVEGDETFWLNLSGLVAGGQSVTLPDTRAVATIVNDDLVNLSISDATVREGYGADQAVLEFVVTRDNASVPVTFELTTSNGTASDNDYTNVVRRISVPANGELTSIVTVNVTGDHRQEGDETIIATLTSPTLGANIANPTATGTIIDDDGTISGFKFHDANDNGQQDAGESGLGGWTIQVLDDDGKVLTSTVTGTDGSYTMGVNEGTWNVQEVVQTGWRQSFPGATNALAYQLDQDLNIRFTGNGFYNWGGLNEKWFFTNEGWHFLTPAGNFFKWDGSARANLTGDFVAALGEQYHQVPSLLHDAQPTVDRPITVVAGQDTSDVDFGNVPTGRIEGRKFHDLDADGVRDANEPYMNGWSVSLTDSTGAVVGTAVTADLDLNGDGDIDPATEIGWYRFDNLLPDTYLVSEESRIGWSQNGADGPFASAAYDLDQSLDFRQPANDFFNWGGLSERWVFSGTDGWHFITPNGELYRWNQSPRANLSGDLVATLNSSYWQNLSLLYNAQRPNRYQVELNGQQVSDVNFANTFGHDGTGSGNVQVAMAGNRLTITGDSAGNTVIVYVDEAASRTVITTSGGTLNGATDPFIVNSTTINSAIDVQLGDGNDQFVLVDADLTGSLSINSGNGNDRISFSQVNSTAPVSISNSGGTDTRRIVNSDLAEVTLDGAGSSAIADSTLSGNLTSASGGLSRLAVARSSVAGTATVSGSASGDRFLMFQADVNRLNLTGAGGNDVLALIESSFDTALTVNLDAGNDSFALKSGNSFGSGSSLNGAAGTDRIANDGSSAAITTSNVETNSNSQLESLIDIALSSFDDLMLDL